MQHTILPPPKVPSYKTFSSLITKSRISQGPQAVIRDKKSGNNAYSAAGDDDINDVAAMGGVNLAEEANVRSLLKLQMELII